MKTSPALPRALICALSIAGLSAAGPLVADTHGDKGHGQHGQMHGGKHGEMHGKGGGHCRHGAGKAHQGAHGLYAPSWRSTLTDEQKRELDQIEVAYVKQKAPLKAAARALKAELASLAITEETDPATIDARIAELLEVEREMLRARYAHVSAQRGVLTAEQRVPFDLDAMRAAMRPQAGKGRHGH